MKAQCLNCNDIIESKYAGHWVSCKCFQNEVDNKGIYIDSCSYDRNIWRYGGTIENIFWIPDDAQHK